MSVEKNDVMVEMMMADGQPYYKIAADLYECASCGRSVLTGFARQAVAEHWQEKYKNLAHSIRATFLLGKGISGLSKRKRKKDGPQPPSNQLHSFKGGDL
jgi:hypothetical protein